MSRPPDFERPDAWQTPLGEPQQPNPVPPGAAGGQPAPPTTWPQPTADWAVQPREPRVRVRYLDRMSVILPLVVALLTLSVIVTNVLSRPRTTEPEPFPTTASPSSDWSPLPTREPSSTPTSAPSGDVVPVGWQIEPWQLRDDVGQPEFLAGIDGTFEAGYLMDAGPVWVMLTDPMTGFAQVRVHGVDAATGEPRWHIERDQAMCAMTLLDGALICAGASVLDPATGLGTKWRIDAIEPASGDVLRSTDFDGWLTAILVADGRVVLVEERMPAPHAVVSALDADLQPAWTLNLAGQGEHDRMFSTNRIVNRSKPLPSGPALDRIRVRTVAGGLTALWIGQGVAFIDVVAGELKGLPRCSRLVDDGERLWCNAGEPAVAYSYDLQQLYLTELGVRLAFPSRDPRGGDISDPVFTDRSGGTVRVDLASGQSLGPLIDTEYGEAFGQPIAPTFEFVGGTTFTVIDHEFLVAFNARTGELLWDARVDFVETIWAGPAGQLVVVTGLGIVVLDAATGHQWFEQDQPVGLYTTYLGDVLVGSGPREIARLVGP